MRSWSEPQPWDDSDTDYYDPWEGYVGPVEVFEDVPEQSDPHAPWHYRPTLAGESTDGADADPDEDYDDGDLST